VRIYIAAPLAAAGAAQDLASAIGREGHTIVSGWHALVAVDSDPIAELERVAILASNLADLDRAQGVIALTHFPDVVGRGTYGEIAWALSRGLPVAWVQDGLRGRSIFDAHALVDRFNAPTYEQPGAWSLARILAEWARTHEIRDANSYWAIPGQGTHPITDRASPPTFCEPGSEED